jgi:hypothetical protein
VTRAKDWPDLAYFVIGALIGALLGEAVASVLTAPLWVSMSVVIVSGLTFGFLGVALREEILFLFLP